MAKGDMVPADAAAADEGPTGADLAEVAPKKGGNPAAGVTVKRPEPGFFTIYKRGQGKWTRLGTVFAAAGLGLLTAYNLYYLVVPYLPVYNPEHPADHSATAARQLLFAGVIAFLVGFGVLTYWLMNRPTNADFLIATDSEMKKVNWTTKGELLGSTRVVVVFLVFVALFLLAVDLIFQWFFRLIGVLHV